MPDATPARPSWAPCGARKTLALTSWDPVLALDCTLANGHCGPHLDQVEGVQWHGGLPAKVVEKEAQ